jgi:hypothetical protein
VKIIALLLWTQLAGGAELIEVDGCVEASADEIRRIVRVELGHSFELSGAAAQIGCEEDGQIRLHLDDTATSKSVERRIAVGAKAARARLLALALVELISASWAELETPAPRTSVVPPPSLEVRKTVVATLERLERRAGALPALGRFRLFAVAGLQGFLDGPGVLGGAGLRLGRDHKYHVGWAVDAMTFHGQPGTSLGPVTVDTLSLSGTFFVHGQWSRVALRGGVGLRGGAARLGGQASQQSVSANSLWGPWLGPMAELELTVAATRRLAVELGGEVGYVVLPVVGLVNNVREVAVDGPWFGLNMRLGFFL